MAESTLQHDTDTPPTVRKGHGTASLGPSDSSDSGSDIQGGPGLNQAEGLFPHAGNTSDDDVDGRRTKPADGDDLIRDALGQDVGARRRLAFRGSLRVLLLFYRLTFLCRHRGRNRGSNGGAHEREA